MLLERLSSIDPARGQYHDAANAGRHAGVHAADRLLGHGRPGRTGARVDGVGPVQRAVVSSSSSRRRRLACAWRSARPRSTSRELVLSQSLRPVGIGLVGGGGLAAAVAIVLMATPMASEIGDIVTCLRSRGVRREPAGDRHLVRAGGVGSRSARRPHRSDRDAQEGLRRVTSVIMRPGWRPSPTASCRSGATGPGTRPLANCGAGRPSCCCTAAWAFRAIATLN